MSDQLFECRRDRIVRRIKDAEHRYDIRDGCPSIVFADGYRQWVDGDKRGYRSLAFKRVGEPIKLTTAGSTCCADGDRLLR